MARVSVRQRTDAAHAERTMDAWPLAHSARGLSSTSSGGTAIMGKYILGWILGVPVFVLVIIYFIFN
jgi:hypothetical protein